MSKIQAGKASMNIIALIASVALIFSMIPSQAFGMVEGERSDNVSDEMPADANVKLESVTPYLQETSVVLDKKYVPWKDVEICGLGPNDYVEVKSSNNSIATAYVSGSTISISAYKKGSTTIQVLVDRYDEFGGYFDEFVLSLNVKVTNMNISSSKSVNDSLVLYKGESVQLKISGKDPAMKVSFISRNKKVATISSKGKVKAKGYGSGSIDVKVGDNLIAYPVSVGSKKGVKAVRWAIKYAGKAKYSNAKRMSKGYFDCSSLTGRAYLSQGMTLGGAKSWSTTAAGQALWCKRNGHVLFDNAKDIDVDQMRPGDLLFYKTGYAGLNPEYRHIDHVAIYAGNGYSVEVAKGVVSAVGWGGYTGAIMIGRPTQYATPVPMVTGLSAKKASSSSVKISWKKKKGVTGYQILRASDDKNGEYKIVANVKGASKRSYTDKKLEAGHTYYYKIRAYKKSKGSTFLGRVQSNKNYMPVIKSVRL